MTITHFWHKINQNKFCKNGSLDKNLTKKRYPIIITTTLSTKELMKKDIVCFDCFC